MTNVSETTRRNANANNQAQGRAIDLAAAAEAAQKLATAKHPTKDQAESVAKTLSTALAAASSVIDSIDKNMSAGEKITDRVQAAWNTATGGIASIKAAVDKFNNASVARGSVLRLKISGTEVSVSTMSASQSGRTSSDKSARNARADTDALARDNGVAATPLDGIAIHDGIEKSPYYPILRQAAEATAADHTIASSSSGGASSSGGTSGSGGTSSNSGSSASNSSGSSNSGTSSSSGSHTSKYTVAAQAARARTAGNGEGSTSAGEGSPIMTALLANLNRIAKAKKGETGNAASGKSSNTAKPTAAAGGQNTAQAASASGGTGTGYDAGDLSAQNADAANNMRAGSDSDSAGLDGAPGGTLSSGGGDPFVGYPNINGLLMAVLLLCYKDGQKDLRAMALRLKETNSKKNALRTQLDSSRKADDKKQAGANSTAADTGPSTKTQGLEDKLNSLGDDAQMQQLQLQNLAQNQSQLLQMISDFSKNANSNSMAIIRNIAG